MSAHYPKAVLASGLQRVYRIWCKMRERCTNPRTRGYKNYGGRGIAVCEEWSEFSTFCEWALANGYAPDLSIERRDCNLGYSPANCAWATKAEQNRNRRNVATSPCGQLYSEAAAENGIGAQVYYNRIARGWPPELASVVPNLGKRAGARTRLAHYLADDGKIHQREGGR